LSHSANLPECDAGVEIGFASSQERFAERIRSARITLE
jgi:hypothetical protein